MVQKIRGEVELEIDGKLCCLCLTLGALAEIEHALGISEKLKLDQRLQEISANDVIAILAALLEGGGNAMPIEQLRRAKLDPGNVAQAIANAFSQIEISK